jgi:hypothetical protein
MLGHLEPYLGDPLRPAQQHQIQAGHDDHVHHQANQEVPGTGHGKAKPVAAQQSEHVTPVTLLRLYTATSVRQPASHDLSDLHHLA